MTKKLNKEQEECNYILSIPRKPGYPDGCAYGRVLVEKIQWMDEHLGKLPAEYRSLFEISDENCLKEMLSLYEENRTVRYFDECQNGVYSEALKALRVYRGISKNDRQSRALYASQDYSVGKKHVISVSNTEEKKIGIEKQKLEGSYSASGEKSIKDDYIGRKDSTDKARERLCVEAVRRSYRAEKCKRKHAEEVLRKVDAEKKEMERQSCAYWANVFIKAARKQNNLEKSLQKMQGSPIAEDDIQDIKNMSMHQNYEDALRRETEKEQKKRNRARRILSEIKKEERTQEEKTKVFWKKKEEDALLKKYAGVFNDSDEWKRCASIKLRRYEEEYKKAKLMLARRGVKRQTKSEKIKEIRDSYIELRALQKKIVMNQK